MSWLVWIHRPSTKSCWRPSSKMNLRVTPSLSLRQHVRFALWFETSTFVLVTYTSVGFSGENVKFQDLSSVGSTSVGISINLYQSVTEKTMSTSEVPIDLAVTIYLREYGFSHQCFPSLFLSNYLTYWQSQLLMSFFPIIWFMFISPVAMTTTIATTTTGETCRIKYRTLALQQIFSHAVAHVKFQVGHHII